MTAGRRPLSIREMRAARAVSVACAGEDCEFGSRTKERLLAESLGESKEETEAAAPRKANRAVSRSRTFVVVDLVVVDFIGDLMGANRITFEYRTIPLVGWGAGEKPGCEGAGYLRKKSMRSSDTRAGSSCWSQCEALPKV